MIMRRSSLYVNNLYHGIFELRNAKSEQQIPSQYPGHTYSDAPPQRHIQPVHLPSQTASI